MSRKTEPRPIDQPHGDCSSCGGTGKIGMYWERCLDCDGSGSKKCNHDFQYIDIPNGQDGVYCTRCGILEEELETIQSESEGA